jgi:hypothetical protein
LGTIAANCGYVRSWAMMNNWKTMAQMNGIDYIDYKNVAIFCFKDDECLHPIASFFKACPPPFNVFQVLIPSLSVEYLG